MQSCTDCPSYIADEDQGKQVDRFQKAPGGPMCGRFGYVLGSTKSTDSELKAIANHFAMICEKYGEPMPDEPDMVYARVADADPSGMAQSGGDSSVKSCNTCANQVGVESVRDDFGWYLPMCSVKGNLIFRPMNEARQCPWAVKGTPKDVTVSIKLRNVYEPGFRIADEVAVKAYISVSGDTDPREYPTDKEVTDADKAEGIRAWRKVLDHETGKFVFAPIFSDDAFTEEQLLSIPRPGDNEHHPELYVDYNDLLYSFFVDSIHLRMTSVLEGEAGVGKTEFFRHVAYLCNMPFIPITCYDEMDVAEVLGSVAYSPEAGTYFDQGILPKAVTQIGVPMLDEPNLAPDSIRQAVRPLTDGSRELRVDKFRFPKHKWCLFGMAQNASWDMKNLGTKEMADADQNRVYFYEVTMPPEAIERYIIKQHCQVYDGYDLPDDTLDKMMAIAADIRAAKEEGSYPSSWATRQQIKVARKTQFHSLRRAYYMAALNHLPPEVRDIVETAITTHLGN